MTTRPVSLIFLASLVWLVNGVPYFCYLDYEVGSCKAAIPRWFYSTLFDKCEEFIYGGCEGNENNFSSQEECLDVCSNEAFGSGSGSGDSSEWDETSGDSEETSGELERCQLEAFEGPCKAAIPRWFHNPKTNQCEFFLFGGCDGNENNFSSEEECQDACGSGTSIGGGSSDSWESTSSETSGDSHYELL